MASKEKCLQHHLVSQSDKVELSAYRNEHRKKIVRRSRSVPANVAAGSRRSMKLLAARRLAGRLRTRRKGHRAFRTQGRPRVGTPTPPRESAMNRSVAARRSAITARPGRGLLAPFHETEQAHLRPLSPIAPECAVWEKVGAHPNAHVRFEHCRYWFPYQLMGRQLWLQAPPDMVRICDDHALVATHVRLFKPGDRSTLPERMPPDAQAYLMRAPQWCRTRPKPLGRLALTCSSPCSATAFPIICARYRACCGYRASSGARSWKPHASGPFASARPSHSQADPARRA